VPNELELRISGLTIDKHSCMKLASTVKWWTMGAKTWMLVYSAGDPKLTLAQIPALDRIRTEAAAKELFPKHRFSPREDCSLYDTCPRNGELTIGCFPDVTIVAAKEFAIDYPSRLDSMFIDYGGQGSVYMFAMHSVVDWFAFAIWKAGKLQRSLSISPDSGVMEDIGARLEFEQPFWNGKHPVNDPDEKDAGEPYPLAFHPLELGDVTVSNLLGFSFEGRLPTDVFDGSQISLMRFGRRKPLFGIF
jgi:hypothetical protein